MLEFGNVVLMAAVQKMWETHRATTLSSWAALYRGTPLESVITELYDRFRPTDNGAHPPETLSFAASWHLSSWLDSQHALYFSQEGIGDSVQSFGHDAVVTYDPDGQHVTGKATSTVGVYCLSPHPHVPQLMARLVRDCLRQERTWLVLSGIDVAAHVGTAALHQPAELVAAGATPMFGQRVEAALVVVEDLGRVGGTTAVTRKPVAVTEVDDMMRRLYDSETRTPTDLGGTFRGKVQRK